ncbi:MAG: T9SS type A sorting domain-containing protein, partial [bacterium]
LLNLFLFNLSSFIYYLPSIGCCADTLVYWEPEQRLTYDSIPQLHCQVWAYDSFVHILVNYDFPAMYLRSADYGQTWSEAFQLNVENSSGLQTLVQQDSVVYFAWSEYRDGPPYVSQVDTLYAFFRQGDNCGMSFDSVIFLGKGVQVSIDAKVDSIFITPVVGEPPPTIGSYLISSYNGGSSWSNYFPIIDSSGTPNVFYRNGVLHFAGWRDYKVIYTRSTDLGNSWSTPTVITAPNTVLPKRPVLALGPNQDVYIAWTDNKYSGAMQFDDVLFRKSTDDGLTWGPEQRLTSDSHCDVASIDMVSQDSMIFIVWNYNGLGYPTPCSLFFLVSTDCGETWRQRETVKEGFSIATVDANVAVVHDYVYVIWRDNQYGPTDEVSIRRGSFTPPGIKGNEQVSVSSVDIYPNLFSKEIRVRYMMHDAGYRIKNFSIKMFDVSGKAVVCLRQRDSETERRGEIKMDMKDLPCGVYFVEVRAGDRCMVKKVIKIK